MSTHNIPFLSIKNKIILNYPKPAAMDLFQGTQEQVQNSRGKQAISGRAIEVLLYMEQFLRTISQKTYLLPQNIKRTGS